MAVLLGAGAVASAPTGSGAGGIRKPAAAVVSRPTAGARATASTEEPTAEPAPAKKPVAPAKRPNVAPASAGPHASGIRFPLPCMTVPDVINVLNCRC